MPNLDTEAMHFTDGHGREVTREVKQTLDVRDYLGLPGYPWLIMAANPHLSLFDLVLYLDDLSEKTPGVQRSRSWIQRRRWLFRLPTERAQAPVYDPDRQHDRAVRIMAEHPTVSVRNLTKLLQERGITRGREFVRQHRCDGFNAHT